MPESPNQHHDQLEKIFLTPERNPSPISSHSPFLPAPPPPPPAPGHRSSTLCLYRFACSNNSRIMECINAYMESWDVGPFASGVLVKTSFCSLFDVLFNYSDTATVPAKLFLVLLERVFSVCQQTKPVLFSNYTYLLGRGTSCACWTGCSHRRH